jgi:acyl-CoA reductase-like NAD-dependent aldehyde dehydrogenase
MRYFEFSEPYYGLISAKTKADAVKDYMKYVAYEPDLDKMSEVPRNYALRKFAEVLRNRIENLSDAAVEAEFKENENGILLIDGAFA